MTEWSCLDTSTVHTKQSTTVATRTHVHSHLLLLVQVAKVTLPCAFNHLVLVHLCQSLSLAALVLTEHAACHPSSAVMETWIGPLVLTVSLDTLHIKVTAIESICQVIYVIQQIALGAS